VSSYLKKDLQYELTVHLRLNVFNDEPNFIRTELGYGAGSYSEDSAHVGAINLVLEPLAWWIRSQWLQRVPQTYSNKVLRPTLSPQTYSNKASLGVHTWRPRWYQYRPLFLRAGIYKRLPHCEQVEP